jgi:hypothetical protein
MVLPGGHRLPGIVVLKRLRTFMDFLESDRLRRRSSLFTTICTALLLISAESIAFSQSCRNQPLWSGVMTPDAKADLLEFWNLQKVESADSLAVPYVIPQPFAFGEKKVGAFSDQVYDAWPWRFNQRASPANCQPYGNPWTPAPDACNSCAGSVTGSCSGQRIPRPPSNSLRTPELRSLGGIQFHGSFDGTATTSEPKNIYQGYVQAVFYHENRDYLSGAEYGFYRTPLATQIGGPEFVFYWSTNSNCGGNPLEFLNPVCSDTDSGSDGATWLWENSPKVGKPQSDGFYADVNSHGVGLPHFEGDNHWSAWPCRDADNFWKFRIVVIGPDSVVHLDELVDPNLHDPDTGACKYGCWYPIELLNRSHGYVTATTNLYDPYGLITLNCASLTVISVKVGHETQPPRRVTRR